MPEKISKETAKTFNPNDHLQDIKGKPYLPVAWRLVWFREEHPDWEIRTDIIEQDETHAIVKASISNEKGRTLATAHKKEDRGGFGDFLEKAETGSIGRSLAMVGYGTQFSPDIEEGNVRIVDSPIELSKNASEGIVEAHKPIGTVAGETQRKMYFAVAKGAGYDSEIAKAMAKKQFNLESFNDVTNNQLSKLITAMTKKVKDKESTQIADDALAAFDGGLE